MGRCNAHYYATRDPLGAAGDFTTAPEISQMFGEILGAALADCWARAGAPTDAIYAELGPGRGTLADDALRVLCKAGFAGEVHLVETSPALREEQARRVPGAHWLDAIEQLPQAPLLLVANEFLDALPVRQWVGEQERDVVVRAERFSFSIDGSIREDSPARDAAVDHIARHLAAHGGVALIIDYGHGKSTEGDTLQAVRGHGYADPLSEPGEADLTTHVDFEAVGNAARAAGAEVTSMIPQGVWLERLGIAARTKALAQSHAQRAEELELARKRLCDSDQMGDLFKVIAIHSPDWPVPAGFE